MKNFIYILIFLGFLFSCTKGPGGIYEPTSTEPNLDSLGIVIDSLGNYIDSLGNVVIFDENGNILIVDSVITPIVSGTIGFYRVDNNLYKTTNSGVNWTLQNDQIEYNTHNDMSFVNESNGYYRSDDELYKTIDGGVSWTLQYTGLEFSEYSNLVFVE